MADLQVNLKSFQAARSSIADLERLQRNDADTYILKIRVLMNEYLSECVASNFNGSANILEQQSQTLLSKR